MRLGEELARDVDEALDAAALALHLPPDRLGKRARQAIERIHSPAAVLGGKTVLVVDDDVRNIFAMTGLLERQGVRVLSAENGNDALSSLEDATPPVDAVLMDIMMPAMDGYDTMRAIRRKPRFRDLPIIALTAKAMKGDREKCLDAGASDYVSKPVDTDRLMSLLCASLRRGGNRW